MFEYKDDFLLGLGSKETQTAEVGSFDCQAAPADDQLMELASLVGGDRRLGDAPHREHAANEEPRVEPLHLHRPAQRLDMDDAPPRLEFDLEEELARAFDAPHAPQKAEPSAGVPDTGPFEQPSFPHEHEESAGEAAGETDMTDDLPEMPAVSQQHSETALAQLISDEFERSESAHLTEPAGQADEPYFHPSSVTEAQAESFEDRADADLPAHSQETLDDFSMELSRLLTEAETPAEPIAAPPPAPAEMLSAYDAAIIDPPDAAQFVVQSPDKPAVLEWREPDPTDFGTEQVMKQDSADAHSAPDLSMREASADEVMARANALRTVADDRKDVDQRELDSFDADLEDVLSKELNSALDDPAFEYQDAAAPAVAPQPSVSLADQRRTGWKAAAAIVGVALIGGTCALAWNMLGEGDTKAPTILAATEPAKVKPQDTGGKVVPNQDQSVYQAVDGKKPDEPVQTALKDSTEKPLAVAKQPTTAPQNSDTDPRTTGGPSVKPRRVRTVVVRPDGTIVTATPGSPAAVTTTVPVKQTAPVDASSQDDIVETASTSEEETASKFEEAASPETPVQVKPTAIAGVDQVASDGETDEVTGSDGETATFTGPVTVPTAKPVRVARAEPAPAVTAATPQASSNALPTTSSPFAVQVSSQRSAEAARQSYRELTRRFGSVIGGKGVDYRRKEVNGKTYFRVRIPASSLNEAQQICNQMKASGGDCFVTR